MRLIKKVAVLKKIIGDAKRKGKKIGLVPTMGYFHQGHLKLMEKARKMSDLVVVSIYVNPLQFGPSEDYAQYPSDLKRDLRLAKKVGVDIIFAPVDKEMYKKDFSTYVEVTGRLTEVLCAPHRPSHFKGVTTVVAKLFNIVEPDFAFFGQKDYQQLVVIKKMVRDLNMPLKVIPVPTERCKDGLAMSSRNTYLSKDARERALSLYKSLKLAQKLIKEGQKSTEIIKREMRNLLLASSLSIDYISISHPETLEEIPEIKGKVLIALAVRINKVRLIDNMVISRGGAKNCV